MKSKAVELELTKLFLAACIGLCVATSDAFPQKKAEILSVNLRTREGVEFWISSGKKEYRLAEDIAVDYLVRNKSKKKIYLVVADEPEVSAITDSELLYVKAPVKHPSEFTEYKYQLFEIAPGKTLKARLNVKGKKLEANQNYRKEIWQLRVGFSYLLDATNLVGCNETTYHLPCLEELYKKSESLLVGDLLIDVVNK